MGFILGIVFNGEDARGLLALSLSMPLLGEEKSLFLQPSGGWRRDSDFSSPDILRCALIRLLVRDIDT